MEKTQKTPAKEQLSVKTVALNGKESASFLVPDLHEGQQLAVIDEYVLKTLTDLLPTARFDQIRDNLVNKLNECDNMKDMVVILKHELAWHSAVNLLERFFDSKLEVVREAPFNVVKEQTFDDVMVNAGYEKNGDGNWFQTDDFRQMMEKEGYYRSSGHWFKRTQPELIAH